MTKKQIKQGAATKTNTKFYSNEVVFSGHP